MFAGLVFLNFFLNFIYLFIFFFAKDWDTY